MVNLIKKFLLLIVVLGVLAVLGSWLRTQGVVPGFTDTTDAHYRRLCGVEPTSGSIWQWRSEGGTGGFVYYRLNLQNSSYVNRGSGVLTDQNKPDLPGAPWWWGPGSSGRETVEGSGDAARRTRKYEIYDPDKELLFIYAEWERPLGDTNSR